MIQLHTLTNFEMQMYYQNELRFNGVYSRDNLPEKIKYRVYVINIGEYSEIESHWIALFVNTRTVTCVNNFGVEHNSKEIKKCINNKNIITNIFTTQAYDSEMCGYFCTRFIDFMFEEFTNLFSPNNFITNDDIISKYFLTDL